ncbi:hypothetical protein LOTGIDRAFT_203491 [Lottia gigantea]|uniref:FAM32A-like n=1 Tax=Lottia gigantea TaxID=225164 RepID=V4A925_LOTGI|nr:hypothetical protein LOTGIDRAFT_203491 [Lottia gigantea]ESP00454.1 hypothetical protein LOTGIDRAFT_203491 [Lottia gigantea]
MSAYDNVQTGGLKLKGVSDHTIKKKKKKDKKKKKKEEEAALKQEITNKSGESSQTYSVSKKTKAELAYEKAMEKRRAEEILEIAGKTHKERIMGFNRQLDNLTEHFDIPKVSWTK